MSPSSPRRDLVVIGASAGGVEALRELASGLPEDLAAGVLIVLHLPPQGGTALPGILDAAGRLPASMAEHGSKIEPGHLYVAPPDHQLLVDGSCMLLTDEPPENGHRPAVNALFRSAARTRGRSVVGVVLSGVLDDGTAGLVAIKACGGLTIVQDPDDAAYPGMPDSALANVPVDYVLPAAAIGVQLAHLLDGPTESTCHDCGKALASLSPAEDQSRWTGDHVTSAEPPSSTADHQLQAALWVAVRALDEKAALGRRMVASASRRGNPGLLRRYSESAEENARAARLLRSRLTVGQSDLPIADPRKTGESDGPR